MSPYRIEPEKQAPADNPPAYYEEDSIIAWVWFVIGAILILTDVGQPGPWGAVSSLGMLVSGLAIVALAQHYAAKWKQYRVTGR